MTSPVRRQSDYIVVAMRRWMRSVHLARDAQRSARIGVIHGVFRRELVALCAMRQAFSLLSTSKAAPKYAGVVRVVNERVALSWYVSQIETAL